MQCEPKTIDYCALAFLLQFIAFIFGGIGAFTHNHLLTVYGGGSAAALTAITLFLRRRTGAKE